MSLFSIEPGRVAVNAPQSLVIRSYSPIAAPQIEGATTWTSYKN